MMTDDLTTCELGTCIGHHHRDGRSLAARFAEEQDIARWIKDVPLGDGSTASAYVAPQDPRELRESMVWSVELAHELALRV